MQMRTIEAKLSEDESFEEPAMPDMLEYSWGEFTPDEEEKAKLKTVESAFTLSHESHPTNIMYTVTAWRENSKIHIETPCEWVDLIKSAVAAAIMYPKESIVIHQLPHRSRYDEFLINPAIVSAIAAVAVLASAVIAPNPASIIGAGLLIASTVETIMSTASDGKLSLQNGFAEAAKATGGNEQAAAICGMITSFAIGIVGSVLSGAGAAKTISDAAKLGEVSKLTKFQQIMNNATNIVSAGTQAASSAVNITSAVYEKQIDEIKADSKLLEAILMRIQIAQDLDTKQIEKIMEKATAMAEGVKDVIDDCNSTMQSVLSGGSAPAMA